MASTIGWIGLGRMGEAMVKRLLKAGFKVNVWNRTTSKAAPLLEYGAVILVENSITVKESQKIAEWDPFKVIMSEKAGTVRFVDLVENVTYQDQFNEAIGKSSKIILDRRDEKRQPHIAVEDSAGGEEILDCRFVRKATLCVERPCSRECRKT